MIRKFLIGILSTLALLILAAIAIPVFFKDKIFAQVKTAANENLNATLDFKDVDISVFRHFPKLSVGLNNLEIIGKGQFEGVRLLKTDRLDVAVDFWSAISGGDLTINSVFLDKPELRIFVQPDGSANYDITKPSEPSAPSSLKTKLERYEIRDGSLLYEDRGLGMTASMRELNHSGRGEFTEDVFDLVMKTKANSLTVDYGGTKYLVRAKTDWDATMNMDLKNMKFTFKQNSLKINELDVNLDGWVALPNDNDITMDLKFSTPTNDFKDFLSLIPGAYSKDFAGVSASGKVRLAGFAKGTYNEKIYPSFALDFGIDGGNFKYPTLPLGVSSIEVDCKIKSPTSDFNKMTVDIPKFSMKIGQNPVAGHFFLKTPMTDPDVDLKLDGKINLADISKAFPLEGVKTMSGLVIADVFMKARQSQIDAKDYQNMNMGGAFQLQNLIYEAVGTPKIDLKTASAKVSPGRIDLPDFDARLGRSDLKMNGFIDAPLAYFSPNKTMTGNLTMRSNFFDANEWMTPEPANSATKTPSTSDGKAAEKPFDQWNFTLDMDFKKLLYDTYSITDLTTKGNFTPNQMDVQNFGLKIGESDLAGNGQISNAMAYLTDNQTVSGKINLTSGYFNLNQFMTEEPAAGSKTASATAATAPLDPFIVPINWDFNIDGNFGKVKYDNLILDDLRGKIIVKNGIASLADCVANTLGGGIALTGNYDSRQPEKPAFDMNFALQNMGFKSAYDNFITVKKLAPIAQLIDGKFNTTLSIKGLLGKDMMPDFATLTASGFLETLSALLKGWKPLDEIGQKLNADYLRSSFDLKNTKNWFDIADGKVVLKPFDFKINDMDLNIGGSHGLTNDMDYKIRTKIPRKSLEKNAVGAAASSGLNWITGEAGKKGINIQNGEFVNVLFSIGGSMFSPKIKAEFLGTDGQSVKSQVEETATAAVQNAKDSLQRLAQKELEKGKKAASAAAQKTIDSLENIATREAKKAADEAARKVAEEAKKVIGKEIGDQVGEKAGKEIEKATDKVLTNEKTKDEVKKAKEKLEKWDPFKKKGG
jgi:AsmA-like C-terminal region